MTSQPTIVIALGFWGRFRGLMLSKPLPPDQALLIPCCASVHTFFMRYALDLIYLDKHGTVVKLVRHVKPWRMSWGSASATQIVEMPAGGIDRYAIQVGDAMVLHPQAQINHATQTV